MILLPPRAISNAEVSSISVKGTHTKENRNKRRIAIKE
jgi:hypothetical protein|tara:strand:- start:119 stop:232 length:114 start_codon:yes stop_codon:yes gene_type:complete